jgi:DNA-binding XRE family transcriptional regulator
VIGLNGLFWYGPSWGLFALLLCLAIAKIFGPSVDLTPARRIKAARGILGWTQQELADRAHIKVWIISLAERGGKLTRQQQLAIGRCLAEAIGSEIRAFFPWHIPTAGDNPGPDSPTSRVAGTHATVDES